MKTIFWVLVTVLVIIGCKDEKKVQPATPHHTDTTVLDECYRGILQQDTIFMTLHREGNQVTSGTLRYKFFQKDNNEGELSGEIKGDTLLATYTFMSEGAASVREVAFLKKGNNYSEGYGEVADDNEGNITFKDIRKLRFDGKVVLLPIHCE
jgi:hypothetical protein